METTEMSIETLNDLVQINNDRIEGYSRAVEALKDEDADLRTLFTSLIDDSRRYKMALSTEVSALGADIANDTTTSGKIYRAWMSVKTAFTGIDRKSVLESCEYGEDAAQKAYKSALSDEELPAYISEMISNQQLELKAAHDKVKALRDSAQ